MKEFLILPFTFVLFIAGLPTVSAQTQLRESFWKLKSNRAETDGVKAAIYNNKQGSVMTKAAVESAPAYNSGLTGTTNAVVMSGIPGRQNISRPATMEFAIAPLDGNEPKYDQAIFVRSDEDGRYKVALRPGTYWLGPKAKALDPVRYNPTDASFSEKMALVKEGVFTQIDLSETRYAP